MYDNDYYPFGLTFNSSERSGFTTNKHLFNGVEFQDELNLGLYQTLFRMYDPALGRFIQIDPLADFMAGINPYSFGYDNPILYGDPDGLGPIKDFFKKLFNGFVGDNASRQARRSQRKANATGVARSRGKGTSTISEPETEKTRRRVFYNFASIQSMGIDGSAIEPNIPVVSSISIPDPAPDFKDKPIPTGTFSKNLRFKLNSDKFYSTEVSDKVLSDLVSTLKEFNELKLFIVGNTGSSAFDPSEIYGNGERALGRPATLNGQSTTIRALMKARAKAVYDALIEAGIDASRLDYGPGTRYKTPVGRKTSFVFINAGQ